MSGGRKRKRLAASRRIKLLTLGEEALTRFILLKHNVVEDDGLVPGPRQTPS